MNRKNFEKWLHELRTTTSGQARRQLMDVDEDGERYYCCLGLGCEVMGLEPEIRPDFPEFPEYGHKGATLLAPVEFIVWLGLDPTSSTAAERSQGEFDLRIDFPDDINMRDGSNPPTAAGMNDSGFTFSQIADVFAYFGIKGA